MLRKIRKTAAIVFFLAITLLFFDFTGVTHQWLRWLAKIQFLPALLATNVIVVLALLLLTWLFGRVYCSVICPLGVFQDGVSAIAARNKKNRFRYSSAKNWLRYGVLVLFILSFAGGVSLLVSLLDPYSAYGRIASNLFAPLYQWTNNGLAYLSERMNNYTFYSVDVWMKSSITLLIAVVTFIIVTVLAWRNGRTYCNTICPLGTILGLLSKYSLYKPVFDAEKCNQCGLCAKNCKASCIESKEQKIDYSRCVSCMNCLDTCKQGAMKYIPTNPFSKNVKVDAVKQEDNSRRRFLSVTALITVASVKAQQRKGDGGLAVIEDKKIPNRLTPIVPPGSQGAGHLNRHCTACQLCVSACPNGLLRPSSSLSTWMQPEMSYERGYCRPECTQCSEVCPTGAIRKIDKAEKSSIQIGHAVWIADNCVVNRDEVSCNNCERHCPTGAIQMAPKDAADPKSLKTPVIDIEQCIGCGACEHLCPSRPFSAIYVEGHERHKTI